MSKQTLELDRAYIVNKKVVGPGKVEVDEETAKKLKEAVEHNKDKKPAGDIEQYQRPDGSLTVMSPEVRSADTVFQTSSPEVVEAQVKANEQAEEERAKETSHIKKGTKPEAKAPEAKGAAPSGGGRK